MPARKKNEATEVAIPKKPAVRKLKTAPVASPEVVAVPADMLSLLMSQIQTLTQEVGELRSQVLEPTVSVSEVGDLGELTQVEIDLAEANPDFMPDNFYSQEMPDEPESREEMSIDTVAFEEQNPGLLVEIANFNADVEDIHPALTQDDIDFAEANPDALPEDFYAGDDESEPIEVGEVDVVAFEESNPGLLAEIEAFNMGIEDEESVAVTAEEAGAILAGFDEVMAEGDGVETEALNGSTDDDSPVSADDIAAMFASAEPISEAVSDDDSPVSADDIAAMFASAEPVSEAASDDDSPVSADDIAAMFASANSGVNQVVSTENLSDDEIAQAIEMGASAVEEIDEVDPEDDDLGDLTEEDLVALIRQNIEEQAEVLDEKAAEEAAQAEAMAAAAEAQEASASGVMSAAEIAALLATPDEEGDVVPGQSSAMSDEELRALLADSENGGVSSSIPTADDLEEVGFVKESAVSTPVTAPKTQISTPKPPTGEAELGAIKAVPAHLAVRAMALPVRFEEGKILCKVAEPIDRAALDQLSKTVGFGIIIEPTAIDEVVAGIRVAYAELQDYSARVAVMSGAQNRAGLVEKIGKIWKKSA